MSNSNRDTPKSGEKKRQDQQDRSGDAGGASKPGDLIHELNNVLGVVLGNLELLEMGLEGNPNASSRARDAIDATVEAAKLIARLRDSLPQPEAEPEPVAHDGDAGVDKVPRRAEAGMAEPAEPDTPGETSTDNETILVVDDEPFVRKIAVRILENLGYRVLDAEDGRSALVIIDSDETIDLLLTDVVMPGGMNGGELAREVRARRPDIKVLFVSGYTKQAITKDGILDEDAELISKPYRKDTLAREIRRVLGG